MNMCGLGIDLLGELGNISAMLIGNVWSGILDPFYSFGCFVWHAYDGPQYESAAGTGGAVCGKHGLSMWWAFKQSR